jgi:hypothetical protein
VVSEAIEHQAKLNEIFEKRHKIPRRERYVSIFALNYIYMYVDVMITKALTSFGLHIEQTHMPEIYFVHFHVHFADGEESPGTRAAQDICLTK